MRVRIGRSGILCPAAAAFLSLLSAGCNGGDGSSGGSQGGAGGGGGAGGSGGGIVVEDTPAATFCGAVADPYCEALFTCCTEPESLGDSGGTLEGCKAEWKTNCPAWVLGNLGTLLETGDSVLDLDHLEACLSALKEMAAGGQACDEPARRMLLWSCWSAFKGQIAPGSACGEAKSGDISFVECKDGECRNGTCASFLKAGEVCNVLNPSLCNYSIDEWCIVDLSANSAVCGPRKEVGEPCTQGYDGECKSLTCGSDNTCAAASAEVLCSGT